MQDTHPPGQPSGGVSRPAPLIIPVESQVREFDAKLLLACVAAERGHRVLLGSRQHTHLAALSEPPGIYLAKSARHLSKQTFRLLRLFGHAITFWEEEALVHPPPDIYFGLRLSPVTLRHVSHMFAWGEENAELVRQYPHLPANLPIHITGNPRADLLRPELRPFFADEIERLRAEHGAFFLINTNFSDVNPFISDIGLFLPSERKADKPAFGQAGRGMTLAFAQGLQRHKQRLFEHFLELAPRLAATFPDLNVVLRPHPSENFAPYEKMASADSRIRVLHEGNVIPWLLASKALVHNGCTTAVEAAALCVPALAWQPVFDKRYDEDFQGLPNRLSYRFRDIGVLMHALERFASDAPVSAEPVRQADDLLDHHLAARRGPLASDRIVDVLGDAGMVGRQSRGRRRLGALAARLVRAGVGGARAERAAYHDHRYPTLPVAEVERRIGRFREVLGRFERVRVRLRSAHLFDVLPEAQT